MLISEEEYYKKLDKEIEENYYKRIEEEHNRKTEEEYWKRIEQERRKKEDFILTGIPAMNRAEDESYHGDVEEMKRAEQKSLERAERKALEKEKLERTKRIEKILGGYK